LLDKNEREEKQKTAFAACVPSDFGSKKLLT
jgi:hypothetical protein